jgi:hypothetical protein
VGSLSLPPFPPSPPIKDALWFSMNPRIFRIPMDTYEFLWIPKDKDSQRRPRKSKESQGRPVMYRVCEIIRIDDI